MTLTVSEHNRPVLVIMETPDKRQDNVQHNTAQKRSVTACQRCRDQKLRCSRERPTCTRCNRLQSNCIYPNPPDRRGRKIQRSSRRRHGSIGQSSVQPLAGRRTIISPNDGSSSGTQVLVARSGSSHNSHVSSCGAPHYDHAVSTSGAQAGELGAMVGRAAPRVATRTSYLANNLESINDCSQSYPTHLRNMSPAREESDPTVDQPALPPRALGLSLLEIYYTRLYNASLLFCKPILFQEYLDGKLPGFFLKALFALATLFLSLPRGDDNAGPIEHSELKVLSAYASCGLPWAKSSQREMMSLIFEEPSLTIIQSLHSLQMYWFGIGKPQSGNLCLALAHRSCQLLGYNKKIINGVEKSDVSLESELKRRCFWACWVSTCVLMEPEPFIRSAWQDVAMLPLPAHISSTPSGYEVIINEKMDQTWCSNLLEPRNEDNRFPTDAASFVKMVGIWAKAQLLVRDSPSPTAQTLDSMQRLSHMAKSIFETATAGRDQANHVNEASSENKPMLLFFHALYHISQITLHSMIIPLFSGTHIEPTVEPDTVKANAEVVTHHAEMFEQLLAPYLYGKGDVTQLAPFVGYGAFIIGIVFLATEVSCQDKSSRVTVSEMHRDTRRLSSVKAILHLLDTLRVYWKALDHCWEKLHAALQAYSSTHRNQCRFDAVSNSPSTTHAIQTSVPNPPALNFLHSGSARGAFVSEGQPGPHKGPDQLIRSSQEQLHPWANDQSAPEANTMPPNSSTVRENSYGLRQAPIEGSDTAVEAQPDAIQGEAWYNLYFTEPGIEQFAGFQPLPFFDQGWSIFS